MQKTNNRKSPTKIAFIGALILLVGSFLSIHEYIESKKVYAYDYMSLNYSEKETIKKETIRIKQKVTEEEDIRKELESNESQIVTDDYIGYLIIPKINLTKGFVDRRSGENDVEKNITVLEGSTYPDVDKGNLILAGHSGTGWKAFFNELYRLEVNDQAHVTYKGKKYIYKIVNIYKQPKVGTVAIYRNYDETTLTLITCTNYDDTTQTVYIAELINIE